LLFCLDDLNHKSSFVWENNQPFGKFGEKYKMILQGGHQVDGGARSAAGAF
jgi:hypothetical protein